jgi:hypothetical protein
MPQSVHTLRTVIFALTVAASLGFGIAQASASPAPPTRTAACDEGMCDYWCGGLGKCRGELCDCY